jgi:hypothetical protein
MGFDLATTHNVTDIHHPQRTQYRRIECISALPINFIGERNDANDQHQS